MKNRYIAICIALSCLFANLAHSQGWEWRTLVPAGLNSGIVMDHSNRVYDYRETSFSGTGGFAMDKLDVNGSILWSTAITGDALVTGVEVDAADNVVLLGNITSSCSIQGQSLIPLGSKSFFLVKLSPSGAVLNASVYGSPEVTFANDLFITSGGDYLIAGASSGTFSMNGYTIPGDTLQTCLLIKTDANQNVIWADKGTMVQGSSEINEVAETATGNYFMMLSMEGGFVDFNGSYAFSGTGQYLTYINSARQIQSDVYIGYPGLSFFRPHKLRVINDNAYMKNQASHHSYAGQIYSWDTACVEQASIGWPGADIGYSILNGKVYFSIIEWNNSGLPNNFWRKLGMLSPSLAIENQHVDSTGTDGADYDMAAIDTSTFYILEDESFYGVFVGKYNMHLATQVAGPAKIKNNPLTIYPNPASEAITLKGLEPGDELIRIYNPLGMLVFSAGADPQLLVTGLPPAVYCLEVSGKSGTRRMSFVKQ